MRPSVLLRAASLPFCFALASNASIAQTSDSAAVPPVVFIIDSQPSGAYVYVDDAPDELTPHVVRSAAGVMHTLRFAKAGFLPLRCTLGPLSGDTVRFTALLERRSVSLSVAAGNPQSSITVDGRTAGSGRVDSLTAELGDHTVTVFDPSLGRSVSASVTLEQYKRYQLTAEFDRLSVPRLWWGALLPGSVQMTDGAAVKGIGLAAAGIGSAAWLVTATVRQDEAQRAFSSALDEYDRASTETAVSTARRIADRKEEEYHTAQDRFRIAAGLAAAVWLGNAVDLFVNHLLTDRIHIEAGTTVVATLPAPTVGVTVPLP